ncbi:hypothetical protein B0H13DRAFT_1882417 [Mycena leptocephala]|nr:hypothetical protein B0H13DRAFT_1882417 [Mycena leptocephala]
MAITRFSSARSSSPTPSENSDMYYEDFDNATPAPSQTADALGWETDDNPAPTDPRDVTPTAQTARASTPAFRPATVTKPRATKAAKSKKAKEKAKATEAAAAEPAGHTSDTDDPFLAADIARATAASLGQQVEHDDATAGASSSSSRRPDAAPGSPSKRQRANTAGDASATASAPTVNPETTEAPTALTFAQAAAPIVEPVAAPAAPAQPAVGGNIPPMWLTADGLPPRGSYTPTPAGGFACIVYEPLQLLQGIPPELILLYEGVPFPKIFLVVSGGNGAVMRTHGRIRDAIGNFINVDPTSFTLSTPPTAANGTSSPLWLLADLPGPLTQAVLDNRVLSSTAITLYPLPYDIPIAGFVGVFAGFTLPNSDAGANAARDLIRAALRNNSEIREFVHTHRSAYGPVAANEAWEILLASIVVQGIDLLVQDTRTVAWRLHVDPPTTDREEWGQFRRLFGKLQVLTSTAQPASSAPFAATSAHPSTIRLRSARSPTPRAGSARPTPPSPRSSTRAVPPLPRPKNDAPRQPRRWPSNSRGETDAVAAARPKARRVEEERRRRSQRQGTQRDDFF